jgi:hypothetical protein
MDNILYKFKPVKILGRGSQGTVILTHDENYVVKIYTKKSKNLKMLVKILDFLINYNNLPKTIYKSYHITEQQNSLNRYLHNNLPQHFSFTNEENLKKLSKNYKIKPFLFEVIKTYKLTLRDFFENLIKNNLNNNIKIEILHSLLYQGLFTLLWLYMKKGIVHLDINADNFFIEETKDKIFNIAINGVTYNVKLYGYYLIIADFGYARSIEVIDYDNYEYSINVNIESMNIHPLNDIMDYIKMFKKYFKKLNIDDIKINLDKVNIRSNYTKQEYRDMLRSYYKKKDDLKNNIKKFKKDFFIFFRKYILNEKL